MGKRHRKRNRTDGFGVGAARGPKDGPEPERETSPRPASTTRALPSPLKVAVGAPVAERAWILPDWLGCLERQTLQPDCLCFAYSHSRDDTKAILTEGHRGCPLILHSSKLRFHPRSARQGDPTDQNRALHFSRLRNELRALFLATDADICVSLDTDILLTDPTALERLVGAVTGHAGLVRADTGYDNWDVAAPLLCLHPTGFDSHCYNAGWWMAGDPGDPQRIWRRADENDYRSRKTPVPVDIVMGAFAIRRHALAMCRYKPHELGEDLGFADALCERHRAVWLTDLPVDHIWDRTGLEAWRNRELAGAR